MMQKSGRLVFWGVFGHLLIRAALEEQQKEAKKTDRSGLAWWDPDPNWLTEPVGPLGLPVGPPAPQRQVGPPAPLDQGRPPAPLDIGRPPAPLDQGRPPAPLQGDHVTRGGVHAEDIRCMRSGGVTLLSALVVPPPSHPSSRPVFEDAAADPSSAADHSSADCLMRPGGGGGGEVRRTFQMHVQHFSRCGVRVQHAPDGKEWISVTLRFPVVEGLRSADDEYVVVMCRPQDRVVATQHTMDMRGTAAEGGRSGVSPKAVFRGEPRDVSCRVSLLSRPSADAPFSREMKSGAAVGVGQELQIRAAVREGDGWNYAMLKDVSVSRVSSKAPRSSLHYPQQQSADANSVDIGETVYRDRRQQEGEHDVAHLVLADGCRNPLYRPVAPFHPQRDPQRPLTVSFTFRAFMFQDMLDGETLRLTAQVVACSDMADCQQSFCDVQRGVGKKKRRRREGEQQRHLVANFTDDFELVVNIGGFSTTPLASPVVEVRSSNGVDCKLVVASVGAAAALLCVATTAAAAIAIGGGRKRSKTAQHFEDAFAKSHAAGKRR